MTSTKAPTKTLAVASAAALLTLTGCTGGTATYAFAEPMVEPPQSIEFRIPEELIELEEGYAEDRVYESITVSSVDSDAGAGCAVEYEFNFADGGLERYREHQADNVGDATADSTFESDATVDERMASRMTGRSLDEIELSEDYTSAVVPLDCAASPTDDESTSEVSFSRVVGDDSRTLARARVSVMQGGELYVHEPEVYNWQLDSNGNWIQADD